MNKYGARACGAMAAAVFCLVAIVAYGVTHEGTTTDPIVVWGLMVILFVWVGVFIYNIARWR